MRGSSTCGRSGRHGIPKLLAVIDGAEVARGGHSWLERRVPRAVRRRRAAPAADATGHQPGQGPARARRLPLPRHHGHRRGARLPLAPWLSGAVRPRRRAGQRPRARGLRRAASSPTTTSSPSRTGSSSRSAARSSRSCNRVRAVGPSHAYTNRRMRAAVRSSGDGNANGRRRRWAARTGGARAHSRRRRRAARRPAARRRRAGVPSSSPSRSWR